MHTTQGWCHHGDIERDVHVLTDAHGPFEQEKCPGQVTLEEGQQTDPPCGNDATRGVRHRLDHPQPFFAKGTAFGTQAQLGMARGEEGTREHSGREGEVEALVVPRPSIATTVCW
jgi:hypothetical protein